MTLLRLKLHASPHVDRPINCLLSTIWVMNSVHPHPRLRRQAIWLHYAGSRANIAESAWTFMQVVNEKHVWSVWTVQRLYGRSSYMCFVSCALDLNIPVPKLNRKSRVVSAFILSILDYCNAVLAGLPPLTLAPLQRVMHAAARGYLRPQTDGLCHIST